MGLGCIFRIRCQLYSIDDFVFCEVNEISGLNTFAKSTSPMRFIKPNLNLIISLE